MLVTSGLSINWTGCEHHGVASPTFCPVSTSSPNGTEDSVSSSTGHVFLDRLR